MNGKTGNIVIDIDFSTKPEPLGAKAGNLAASCKASIGSVLGFCKEDRNRVLFSLKVGLAVVLVSLLILFRAPYDVFGTNIIWAIITVAIMFEYTVGATFNRGFNRALGSLLAGILAIAVAQLALRTGPIAEPIIIGITIFLVGSVTSFMKLWPSLVPYEYGFRVILFTYCLIVVSGYRMGNPLRTAMDRLYSIAIGGFVAVLVNVLVFPIWAGEQLHKDLVATFNSLADSLQECVNKYLEDEGSVHNIGQQLPKAVMDEFPDEPAYKKCKATLNSSAKFEALATSAKWEPPHGRFRHFFYPWAEYVKVGAVLRYCAYEIMALHGVLHSPIQAPYKLRTTFKSEIQETANQAAELLRSLGKDINNMQQSLKIYLLKNVHTAADKLQQALHTHSYPLTPTCDSLDLSSKLQSKLSTASSNSLYDLPSLLAEINGNGTQAEACVELVRKQSRRQHSWPLREMDVFDDGGGVPVEYLQRMRKQESTAAMSLANFTSLLIEFVARLDYLVETVDELSKMAKFKDKIIS
ncbi:aluminum-activated malate transporter 9-like [Cucurbita pepo subsp. pepo]|uniref:aluminum-activated malate transporter 9-like n=1 Tax=Cucurbita pepo subsp. pepo TaxID=3664 RepID=UPI000C9DA1F2|nr:aluminum-activated malate transporter 9-like [Cucurbita pepo subsp. pepo]